MRRRDRVDLKSRRCSVTPFATDRAAQGHKALGNKLIAASDFPETLLRCDTPAALVACARKRGRPVIVGAIIMLATGCAHQPVATTPSSLPVPPVPSRASASTKPQDWFHEQLVAARAAKRAHQPKTDTVGAQQASDDVMRTACTRAALAGPGKYPSRCDAILSPASPQPLSDPCDENADDPVMVTECND